MAVAAIDHGVRWRHNAELHNELQTAAVTDAVLTIAVAVVAVATGVDVVSSFVVTHAERARHCQYYAALKNDYGSEESTPQCQPNLALVLSVYQQLTDSVLA